MQVRLAHNGDAAMLFAWRNEETVRQQSFNSDPIDWATHVRWLEMTLASSDQLICIALEGDKPAGSFRLEKLTDSTVLISITVAPMLRGQGLGSRMLRLAAEQCRSRFGPVTIVAQIKADNEASLRAFAKAGYTLRSVTMELQCD
nr:GNAT family N-acetyltransferase [Paenibacillus phyllosphaerae]